MMRILRWILPLGLAVLLEGCGYTTILSLDEQATTAWSDVLNQYQRRADLVPDLVNAVKGRLPPESDVTQRVTDARARLGTVQVTPELLNNPDGLTEFQAVQGQLSAALVRLLAVADNQPALKADTAFRDLRAQLEGSENRITVARNRYIRAVQDYNMAVRAFPGSLTAMVLGYAPKPNFALENDRAPPVALGSAPPTAASGGR